MFDCISLFSWYNNLDKNLLLWGIIMKFTRYIILTVITIFFLCGCTVPVTQEKLTYTDTLFDTVISIQILDSTNKELLKGCEEICKKYDTMFSRTNKDSDISKINSAKGKTVEVSDDTISIIKEGIYFSELSNGAFDITIGTVSSLWDFRSEEKSVPSPDTIKSAVSHINYQNIIVNGNTVQLTDPNTKIDVGALAKGYIADKVKEYLLENDVKHAIIDLGGNVLVIGSKPDGSDYNIGIQKPFDQTGVPVTSVKLSDRSIVTTGIYQRFFESDGDFYHHILDPETGYPCKNNLYSATIVTDSSLKADALSTTCFLLGLEEGMDLINHLEYADAVFITYDNELHYSKDFQK